MKTRQLMLLKHMKHAVALALLGCSLSAGVAEPNCYERAEYVACNCSVQTNTVCPPGSFMTCYEYSAMASVWRLGINIYGDTYVQWLNQTQSCTITQKRGMCNNGVCTNLQDDGILCELILASTPLTRVCK